MAYRYQYTSRAERQLDRLPHRDRERVLRRVAQLAEEPRGHQAKQLKAHPPRWASRVGQLRIVYVIEDSLQVITVHAIGNGDNIYDMVRRSR